jgi:autoinducer 2-degrading protein
MLGLFVKVRIKPEKREQFLKAIEEDALGSERDEPGCQRFNVLQDKEDENLYYFYEVYKDDEAFAAHQTMPHYAVWRQAAAECLDGPTERTTFNVVFPRPEDSYWPKG